MNSENQSNSTNKKPKVKVKLVCFVWPETAIALESLNVIYGVTSGQLIDSFVHTLRSARAEKYQWCITGKRCQFNMVFPELELI